MNAGQLQGKGQALPEQNSVEWIRPAVLQKGEILKKNQSVDPSDFPKGCGWMWDCSLGYDWRSYYEQPLGFSRLEQGHGRGLRRRGRGVHRGKPKQHREPSLIERHCCLSKVLEILEQEEACARLFLHKELFRKFRLSFEKKAPSFPTVH